MWCGGVLLALIPVVGGVHVLRVGHVTLRGRFGSRLDVFGIDAMIVAVFLIAVGFAIHFYFFWRLAQSSQWVSQIRMLICALIMGGSVALFICRVLAF
jgi:hypothetical protein